MFENNSTTAAPETAGHALHHSPVVREAIETIVSEVAKASSTVTSVRGPVSQEAAQSFEAFMERAASVRGRPLLYPYIGSGVGNGPYVELLDGSVKLDLITGIGVHFFGHSDPELIRASVEGATGDTVMQGHLMMNEDAIRFGSVLIEEARKSSDLQHAFLCGSGAMANENGLKVCYQKNAPASRVIAFKDCFMGRSTTMAQIGDNAAGRVGIPLSTLVDYMPFYDTIAARRMSGGDVSGDTRYIDMAVWHLEQYIERYPGQHACFVFELVQGEGGFNGAPPEFHRELMEVCKANNIAVWSDEVQTFGRTSRPYAFDHYGLGEYVDVCCVGKMTQVCATLYTDEYNPKPGLLSGTFLGSSAGLRAGRSILERLTSGDYYGEDGRIMRHHARFREHVHALAQKHPEWFPPVHGVPEHAGGVGAMMRFTPFGGDKDALLKLCKQLFLDGVIAFYCGHGPYHVRFLPPLGVMDESTWSEVFEIVEKSMGEVARTLPIHEHRELRPMHRPNAVSAHDEG
ncbi:MAG: aspartate aminotransferase family protein [Phycisphaerales bacterium]